MKKIAVIGAGISGLSIAHCLKDAFEIKIFEKESRPGGLIKCERIEGNLYHTVGGHVFNSKQKDVLDWFWNFFDREKEFTKTTRNAVIYFDRPVSYPVENHLYELDEQVVKQVIAELLNIERTNKQKSEAVNFEDFLKNRFGETLYSLYFEPYNKKIWKRDLSKVPISWLEGKLPMPTVEEIIVNNIHKKKEMDMVHSSFYYPLQNGSQFLVDRLSEGLDIQCNQEIKSLSRSSDKWHVNNEYTCDYIVYAGNIKDLPRILSGSVDVGSYAQAIEELEYHGTTTVLCEVDSNPYSWIYLPDNNIQSHRIINTGNFSESNNRKGIKTATIEFTDYVDKAVILENLKHIPYHPRYITHRYTEYTYPIQNKHTREMISGLKSELAPHNMFLTGRFAEWEYYNMDAAIGAALRESALRCAARK